MVSELTSLVGVRTCKNLVYLKFIGLIITPYALPDTLLDVFSKTQHAIQYSTVQLIFNWKKNSFFKRIKQLFTYDSIY